MESKYQAPQNSFKNIFNVEKSRICRICAQKEAKCKDVLQSNDAETIKIIQKFLDICITIKDEFHFICTVCEEKLNEFWKFYKQTQDAQKYFQGNVDVGGVGDPIAELITIPIDVKIETLDEDPDCFVKQEPDDSDPETFDKAGDDFPEIKSDNDSDSDNTPLRGRRSSFNKDAIKDPQKDALINDFFDFTCPECRQKIDNWKGYKTHMVHKHGHRYPTVSCCNLKIQVHGWSLLGHVEYHTNPEKLRCKYCAKQCTNAKSKRTHEWRHKTSREGNTKPAANQKRPCAECGKMLSSKYSFEKHMQLHMSTEEREKLKVECDLCKKYFVSKAAIFIHMKIKHLLKQESISCDQCAKSFTNRMAFTSHYRTHHTNEAKVICPDCGIELKADSLRRHRKMKHDHVAQVCPLCCKEFKNKLSLRIHQQRVHIEPKYACDICGRMFKVKDKLKEHRTTHFTTNRFSCDQCDYVNNDYANMLKHRKTKHPDAPPLIHGASRKVFEAGHNSSLNPGF